MSDQVRNVRTNVYINEKEAGQSLRSLENRARKVRNQLAGMTRDSEEYKQKLKEWKGLRKDITAHKKDLYGVRNTWKSVADGFNRYFALATAGLAAISGMVLTVKSQMQGAYDLSDVRADVIKTTDLSIEEIERLEAKYKTFNTRTPRSELHKLAVEAGKMGIRGVASIAAYVEQANELKTALGDDLGEDAALQMSKMADVYNTELRNIASGINALADSTKANAGYLTEWGSRMAGTSKELNILAGDTLGYGVTLDELNLKVEMSSTALNNFFIDFTKNTEAFAQAAGFANGELSALIGREGVNEGFLAFLKRLRENNQESDEFLRRLEELGISGSRGSQVFLALSQNVDKVRENQMLANREIEKGTSITDEYARKNNNLAAKMDRVQRRLYQAFVSPAVVNGLEKIFTWMVKLVDVPLSETIAQERMELRRLELQLYDTNTSTEDRLAIIRDLQQRYPGYLGNLDTEKVTNQELSLAIAQVNDQLINKIILQKQDEKIQEHNEKVANERLRIIEKEDRLRMRLIKLSENQGIELEKNGTLLEQAIGLHNQMEKNAFGGVAVDPKARLGNAITQLKISYELLNDLEGQNNAFLQEKNVLIQRLGMNLQDIEESMVVQAETEKETQEVFEEGLKTRVELTDKEKEARIRAATEIQKFLDSLNQDEEAKLRARFERMLSLAEKYNIDRKALEQAYQQEMQLWKMQNDQELLELEQARKIELMQNSLNQLWQHEQAQIWENFRKELISEEQMNDQLLQAEIRHLQEVMNARRALNLDIIAEEKALTALIVKEKEKQIGAEEKREDSIRDSAAASAFLATSQARNAEEAKNALLNSIKQEIQALLAKAIAGALAKEFATKGLLGAVTGTLAAGAVGALFSSLIPSFHTGGYTGTGLGTDPAVPGRKIAGITHDDEYVVAREELRQPDIAELVRYIEQTRTARVSGTNNTESVARPSNQVGNDLSGLKSAVHLLSDVINDLRENGLPVIADDRFARDLEEKRSYQDFIIEKSEL